MTNHAVVALWACGLLSCRTATSHYDDALDAGARTETVVSRRCVRDTDCGFDALCSCHSRECSICNVEKSCISDMDNMCVSRAERVDGWIPIRTDAGWIMEASKVMRVYGSQAEALTETFGERHKK